MVKTTHNNTDEHFCNSIGLMKKKPDKSKGKKVRKIEKDEK